jgi:hypothetical protein
MSAQFSDAGFTVSRQRPPATKLGRAGSAHRHGRPHHIDRCGGDGRLDRHRECRWPDPDSWFPDVATCQPRGPVNKWGSSSRQTRAISLDRIFCRQHDRRKGCVQTK